MDQIPLQLDREGIKEREDLEIGVLGGGGEQLFEEGDFFKYFHQRGAAEGGQIFEGGDESRDACYLTKYVI